MNCYEYLVQKIGMPIAERATGWPVSKYLRELEESQWWSLQQLQELQNEKLRKMIKHAYDTVPYYRELFADNNLHPNDIKTMADLPKLPILTKDTVRANFPDKIASKAFDRRDLIVGKSSGSTGEPLKYYLSKEEKGFKWACLYRYWRWAGYDFGKKYAFIAVLTPTAFRGNSVLQWLEHRLSRVLTLQTRDLDADTVADFICKIRNYKPVMLKAHPSTCFYMARYMNEHDIKFELNSCICNAETLDPFVRDYVEERFGCGIYDTYGSEGIETAAQCHPRSGHHIAAEAVITEVVDKDGNPAPMDTEGRLIVTALDKWAMPFIRYDTQDAATMTAEQCSCGRGLPLLSGVKGRIVDMGLSPSGKLLSVYAFSPLFAKADGIDAWQVIQESAGELSVKIKPTPAFNDEIRKSIQKGIEDYVGSDVTAEIELVEEIPLTPSGKRRFFISKCSSDVL